MPKDTWYSRLRTLAGRGTSSLRSADTSSLGFHAVQSPRVHEHTNQRSVDVQTNVLRITAPRFARSHNAFVGGFIAAEANFWAVARCGDACPSLMQPGLLQRPASAVRDPGPETWHDNSKLGTARPHLCFSSCKAQVRFTGRLLHMQGNSPYLGRAGLG